MSAGTVLFAVCSIVCLAGALVTVLARNPIRGAVGLLATIVGIAGLFLRLNAQFLAAIQLIVYAGAVVVLFVFVIMLLGPDAGSTQAAPGRARLSRLLAPLLLLAMSVWGLMVLGRALSKPTAFQVVRPDHGSIEAVGTLIFTKGLVPFELATALLIVAAIGAIAVARANPQARKAKREENPTKRLFHGPLVARDAGRPLTEESTR